MLMTGLEPNLEVRQASVVAVFVDRAVVDRSGLQAPVAVHTAKIAGSKALDFEVSQIQATKLAGRPAIRADSELAK